MLRKVFKTGNAVVVSVPKEALDFLGLTEGSEVSILPNRSSSCTLA
jgi:antitoxin component of MazEF toxin-antitoxin module